MVGMVQLVWSNLPSSNALKVQMKVNSHWFQYIGKGTLANRRIEEVEICLRGPIDG